MYDRILVAVDHSEISDRAVVAARDLALLSKGEVWVLHLREREMGPKTGVLVPDETTDEANAEVASSVEVLNQAGVKAHSRIRNTIFGYARTSCWPSMRPRTIRPGTSWLPRT